MNNFLQADNGKGDVIEVKIRDENYNPYFKAKAKLKNKKEVQDLIIKLRSKGVDLSTYWF